MPASAEAQAKFRASLAYLSQDKKFAHVIRALQASPTVFKIEVTKDLVSTSYDPITNITRWNPRMNLKVVDHDDNETSGRLSAGLILGHELAHAYGHLCSPSASDKRSATKVRGGFEDEDEVWVIRNFENPFALRFGEGIRNNHYGIPFTVK